MSGWKCTLVFYMACIYVKALGRLRGKDLQDHYQVKQWLNTEPELREIAKSYRLIEERSRDARYEGRSFDSRELQEVARRFEQVRDRIADLLRQGGVAVDPVDPRPHL